MGWKDAELGEFEESSSGWKAVVEMKAFKAFSYDTGYSNARRSKGKHLLLFLTPMLGVKAGGVKKPTAAMVKLAKKVLANQEALVEVMTRALWDNFNGVGPKSGMWWEGDLAQVMDAMNEEEAPSPSAGPKMLRKWLQVSSVAVLPELWEYKKPIAMIHFRAPFEEEHGVGMLIDGEKVLGIGYAADVVFFKDPKEKKRSMAELKALAEKWKTKLGRG